MSHESIDAADLVARLQRNARFYANESQALAEKPERRDNRHLGAQEAKTVAELLQQAADALDNASTNSPKA